MSFTLPKGTLSFALWAWQLSFSFFFRSYSQPVSGVMIEFPILELYLAARLVYLPGLITARSAKQEGRARRTGVGGRYRRTDLSYILISSGLFSLIWRVFINGRTRLWLLFHSWTTVAGVNVPSTCLLKLNIWTWNKMLCGQIWCILISRVRFNNRVIYSFLKSNVSYWLWNHLTLFDFQIVK